VLCKFKQKRRYIIAPKKLKLNGNMLNYDKGRNANFITFKLLGILNRMNSDPSAHTIEYMIKKVSIYLFTFLLLLGCASLKKQTKKEIETVLHSRFFENQFTGFLVVDPSTRDTIYNLNSNRYFTPASNTKIFTLYTALKILPEKIPALRYLHQNDTLYFEGTGDPSFLHPFLSDSTAYKFLKKYKNLALFADNFLDTPLGPGWSWDDFHWYYSPERSAFPIHGNVTLITSTPQKHVSPTYFKDSVFYEDYNFNRQQDKNKFYFNTSRTDTLEVPFKTGSRTTKNVLESSLGQPIRLVPKMPKGNARTLEGIHADSLYVKLMHESDNFIAEQLLLLAASELRDTLNSEIIRTHILKNNLANLKQPPRWVDGSGLSRYNLFTPRSLVHVLHQLQLEIPQERLFRIFPAGGVSGTLENWYSNGVNPYIFAKSGSLGNNYCLSGYLLTKSGKVLLFSFMNNHFRNPSSEVKIRMQQIFEMLHQNY
jgi:D-alanyl-D-alanine carboxypeptidase/D-alanyl-D-alanine-endopeptidase (penicillin-binding protein 4)